MLIKFGKKIKIKRLWFDKKKNKKMNAPILHMHTVSYS